MKVLQTKPTEIDRDRAIASMIDVLSSLGIDLALPHMIDTPRRWVDAFLEMTTPEEFNFTLFPIEPTSGGSIGDTGIVLVRDIPFTSVCAHHLSPFVGTATIGYIPNQSIAGLSKFPRLLQYYASGPQVQERLGQQVADTLIHVLRPHGVAVIIKARHSCMEVRGAKAHGAETITSCLRGDFYTDSKTRSEFFTLINL